QKFRTMKEQDKLSAIGNERFKNALSAVTVTPTNLATLIAQCEVPAAETGYYLKRSSNWMPQTQFKAGELLPMKPQEPWKVIRTVKPVSQLDRRVHKLLWWINAGYLLGREIDSVNLIKFFSRLVGDEYKMSDKAFAATWDAASAKKLKASRARRELIPADSKPRRSLEYKQAQMAKQHIGD